MTGRWTSVATRPGSGRASGRTQNSTVKDVSAYMSWKNGRCVRQAAFPSKYIALRARGLSRSSGSDLPRELVSVSSSRSDTLLLSVS